MTNDQYHLLEQDIKDVAWGNVDSDWTPPETIPDLSQYDTIAIDLETRDENLLKLGPGWCRKDGHIIGIAVAAGDSSWYFPVAHTVGNMPKRVIYQWLTDLCKDTTKTFVFHNALYDLGWLRAEGIEVKGKIRDTMVAAPLLNENRRYYNLNSLAGDYLGTYKDEKMLKSAAEEFGVDPKSGMWRLPPRYVGAYAEHDASITLRLWNELRKQITKEECSNVFDLETRLTPLLLDMKTKGVRVDLVKAEQVKKELITLEKKLLDEIAAETKVALEPWVATSVAKVFDAVGLSYSRTEKSRAPAFTKQFLANHSHPIAKKIIKIREVNKANTTFIDTILEHSHKGRIHCDFHPLRSDGGGTVTGRFSSSNPNLQQIPARDPYIKKIIRGLFIPEADCEWGSFDYASQEPRWLVHYCATLTGIDRHPQIDDVVNLYKKGQADFHQIVADIADIPRKQAKTVNLGLMYGMGKGKLANILDLSMEEATTLLDKYNDKVPFLKRISEKAMRRAADSGVIRTWLGRKCRFNMYEPISYTYNKALPMKEAIDEYGGKGRIRRAFTYKALNRLIQGSSADQTKKAMVDCYEAGITPMLTVHDELCFNIENSKTAKQIDQIEEIMCNCVPELKIPFEVDVEIGQNWGEVG
jgi:DNA polymerase I-like protein with 3'-5' exonuclease and polymerase domains